MHFYKSSYYEKRSAQHYFGILSEGHNWAKQDSQFWLELMQKIHPQYLEAKSITITASHFVQESYRKIFGERITAVIPDLGTTSTYQLRPPTAQNAFKVYSLHIKYNTSSMIPIMVSIYLFFLSLVLYYIGECTKDGRKMHFDFLQSHSWSSFRIDGKRWPSKH